MRKNFSRNKVFSDTCKQLPFPNVQHLFCRYSQLHCIKKGTRNGECLKSPGQHRLSYNKLTNYEKLNYLCLKFLGQN